MTKRERVLAALSGAAVDHVPASFSLHFPEGYAYGEKAVQAHLDFYRRTDCDILKIMNDNLLPVIEEIRQATDWKAVPAYTRKSPFMQREIDLVRRILDQREDDAYTLVTIHGVCASSVHCVEARVGYDAGRRMMAEHLREEKTIVTDAFRRVTDAVTDLALACLQEGVDGVYYAALGGEPRYFTDAQFAETIAPLDRQILQAIRAANGSVFLHICKDGLNMARYEGYRDAADAVNWGVYEVPFSLEEGRRMFPDAAIMGGLANRSGVLVDGSPEELQAEIRDIIRRTGTTRFILGADCTLPGDISYDRIRAAVHATSFTD